jgi:hypothetical protein
MGRLAPWATNESKARLVRTVGGMVGTMRLSDGTETKRVYGFAVYLSDSCAACVCLQHSVSNTCVRSCLYVYMTAW